MNDDTPDFMPAGDYVEGLFLRVLREKGGPAVYAHISAAVDGFTVGEGEQPIGHTNDAIALSFITSGYTIVKLPEQEDQQTEPSLFKDADGVYMMFAHMTRDACHSLVQDLTEILSEETL